MGRPPADESDEVLDISPSKLERGSASESEAPPPSYRTRPPTREPQVWKNDGIDAHWCFVFSAVLFAILLALTIGLGVGLTQAAHRRAAASAQ
ncbi:hypothetical protein AURDEDRAFT_163833 [Auricularia subglabra TFB-10046 SS5]|nr:hypothetical protein AURDEDRAFT_163833 [Auricularia subglabra TFB-10046 SS5]